MIEISPTQHRLHQLASGSLVLLIVLCIAWELVLAPLRPGGSWMVIKALPLFAPLAGTLRRNVYTMQWASMLVLMYFAEGVVRAWSDPPPSSWLAMGEIALCLALFTACVLHVWVRLRQKRGAAA